MEIKSNEKPTSDLAKENAKIHELASHRFKLCEYAEADIKKKAIEDLKFCDEGDQWPDKIKLERERDGRPCLVINKIPQFVQQITNDQRQNRPSMKVNPVDSFGDIETAKVIQGLIRHIEYNSSADAAYDIAFESAVKTGLGYFRVITQYADPMSFNQEVIIDAIKNPACVSFDPHSVKPDGSDAEYAFITDNMSKDEFNRKYPNSELSIGGWDSIGDKEPNWISEDTVRVAEYFYKEYTEETIVLLNNGETILKSKLPEILPEGYSIVKERTTQVPKIYWCKINGCEILEKKDWLGIYIPIIPVYGSESNIDGVRSFKGVVRNAKDPMRMYNYWATAETEAIALAPKAPYLAAEGQLEGYEGDWETSNRKNHAFLYYKTKALDGTPVSAPQRNAFEPAVQAITQARMLASDDIKATTGIYDASLGNRSNETSGVAIARRTNQGQVSNFHFVDNLTRSLRHAGRIIVDLIPKIYDVAQAARIIAEDGEQKVVKINEPFEENGKQMLYALDVGKYDVTMDVGPSFQTKRQEAVASMLELTRSVPQLMQIAGDIFIKNMDLPNGQELAERIKKTLPPGLVDDPNNKQEIPPEVQAQLQQSQTMIEQLSKNLNMLHDEREMKLIEIESRERIEFKKLEVQVEIKRAELDQKDSLALLTNEIESINQRLASLNYQEPVIEDQNEQENFNQPEAGEYAEPQMMQQPTDGFSSGQPVEGNEQP